MGVRDEDPAQAAGAQALEMVEVFRQGRARVDDREFLLAQDIGVGPGPGHAAGIARRDAREARRQRNGMVVGNGGHGEWLRCGGRCGQAAA